MKKRFENKEDMPYTEKAAKLIYYVLIGFGIGILLTFLLVIILLFSNDSTELSKKLPESKDFSQTKIVISDLKVNSG